MYLDTQAQVLRSIGKECASRLRSAAIDVDEPQGGFYLLPKFPDSLRERGISTGKQLCHTVLRETGVAFLPGVDFGISNHELIGRMAYVNFDGGAAQNAARAMLEQG